MCYYAPGPLVELILLIGISALLLFAAAVFAFRLIRVTGFRIAWVLISSAFCVMAIRRVIVLAELVAREVPPSYELTSEVVGLVISILMLAGVLSIGPLFRTIKAAGEWRCGSPGTSWKDWWRSALKT